MWKQRFLLNSTDLKAEEIIISNKVNTEVKCVLRWWWYNAMCLNDRKQEKKHCLNPVRPSVSFSLFPNIYSRWGAVSSIFSFPFFLSYLICIYLSTSGLSWRHVGSCLVAHGLSSCGTRPLKRKGPVVVVHGLSCPLAWGILVSQPGMKPASPALQDRFLTIGPGKSPSFPFLCPPMEENNFSVSYVLLSAAPCRILPRYMWTKVSNEWEGQAWRGPFITVSIPIEFSLATYWNYFTGHYFSLWTK